MRCVFQIGGLVSSYLAGMAIHQSGRWDIVFTGLGIMLAIWCIFFVNILFKKISLEINVFILKLKIFSTFPHYKYFQGFLCYERPEKHPFVSEEEKIFLTEKENEYLETDRENLAPTPWRKILTNKPVMTLIVCSVMDKRVVFINHSYDRCNQP